MTSDVRRTVADQWRDVRRSHERRTQLRERVRDEYARLRPGLYVPAGPRVWRRLGTPLPEHLRRTKTADPRSRSRRTVDAVRGMVRPAAFRVPRRHAGDRDGYSIAVATSDGGLVLLDPRQGTVARVRTSVPRGADSLRRRLARHVATPRFEVQEEGRLVIEEFVEGGTVLELPDSGREAVLRQLAGAWGRLTLAEADGTWGALLESTFAACAGLELPFEVRRVVERGVPSSALSWPLVPAATDATLRNIVLRNGVPVLIDLGDVRLEPFLAYLLGAVVDAGPAILRAYSRGDLDDAIGPLAAVGGASWPPAPWDRVDLLAVRTCVVTVQEVGTGSEVLAQGIRRRWDPVARALRAT